MPFALVVEDSRPQQMQIRTSLARLGYECVIVSSQPEAVGSLRTMKVVEQEFEIAIVDLLLAGVNGESLIAGDLAELEVATVVRTGLPDTDRARLRVADLPHVIAVLEKRLLDRSLAALEEIVRRWRHGAR